MPTMDSRGQVIRSKRQELGLTMKQVSLGSGVAESVISRVEAGKKPDVSFRVVARIARVLAIPLDELDTERMAVPA